MQKSKQHGGDLSTKKRKSRRAIDSTKSLHVVLKSDKARGLRSLNNNSAVVKRVIRKSSWLFRVKVYSFSLNHNHIHLCVKGRNREDIQNFFRVLAGHMAQEILRKFPLPEKRGNAPGYKRKFWNALLYSRIVSWGRDYGRVLNYIYINKLEALGLICRLKRPKNWSLSLKGAMPRWIT